MKRAREDSVEDTVVNVEDPSVKVSFESEDGGPVSHVVKLNSDLMRFLFCTELVKDKPDKPDRPGSFGSFFRYLEWNHFYYHVPDIEYLQTRVLDFLRFAADLKLFRLCECEWGDWLNFNEEERIMAIENVVRDFYKEKPSGMVKLYGNFVRHFMFDVYAYLLVSRDLISKRVMP